MGILCRLVFLYTLCIFGRIILSWFPLASGGIMQKVGEFLVVITEPLLAPIRRVMPRIGMFDFSPVVAIILVQVVIGNLILGC